MKRVIMALVGVWGLVCPLVAHSQEALPVKVVVATKTVEELNYSLTGEIRAKDALLVSFPIGGRVIDVLAEAGSKVEKGEPLARLDSIQQELALRTAEAGLTTSRANERQAKEDLTRADALFASGTTTRAARDLAQDALRSKEGALEQAKADLDRAKKALADTVLRAPAASTVVHRNIEPGQIIGAAQTAMELALGDGYEAVFDVPVSMLLFKDRSPKVKLARLSKPNDVFEGTVGEISPLVDKSNGTVTAKIEVINPPAGLGYGEPVIGTITRKSIAQVGLPFSALTAVAAGPAVWVVDPSTMKVSLRSVKIDRYETGRFFVASGVKEGEWVVSKGAQLLYPGRLVRRVGDL